METLATAPCVNQVAHLMAPVLSQTSAVVTLATRGRSVHSPRVKPRTGVQVNISMHAHTNMHECVCVCVCVCVCMRVCMPTYIIF